MTKTCARCKQELPMSMFGRAPRMKLGLQSYCRPCNSAWAREKYAANRETEAKKNRERARARYTTELGRRTHIKALYGITWDEYLALLEAQGHACAICQSPEPGGRGNWHVDHEHESKIVRGLLCSTCNVGLGMFKDDPTRLQAAVDYLARSMV